jgi:hypothetical protein
MSNDDDWKEFEEEMDNAEREWTAAEIAEDMIQEQLTPEEVKAVLDVLRQAEPLQDSFKFGSLGQWIDSPVTADEVQNALNARKAKPNLIA